MPKRKAKKPVKKTAMKPRKGMPMKKKGMPKKGMPMKKGMY